MKNSVVWFDIPVTDLERAVRFYGAVLGCEITVQSEHGATFAMIPVEHGECSVTGCLSVMEDNRPSETGPLLYFNCQGRLEQAVDAAAQGGGRILQPAHGIGPWGRRAVVLDSEGNRIALHCCQTE